MRFPPSPVLALLLFSFASAAQAQASVPYVLSVGYANLSNSFNGVPGSRQPLNGWDAGVAFPAWHNLRFKIDVSGFSGNNLGAPQRTYSIMGGGQYERSFHRERLFVHALFGDTSLNRDWGPNGSSGGTASFSVVTGGGFDTPVNRHFAIRVEGDMQHENLFLIKSATDPAPYRIPGLPHFFGRISSGIVWTPRVPRPGTGISPELSYSREPVQSELTFETSNSFGHYHVFGVTWWSYLNVAGLEYDRHSWGQFIGARMDYVAEILPVSFLRQPSKTDTWGNPLTTEHTTNPGLGISPIGLRMIWRDGKNWKPYYLIKAGMIGFRQKALSQYASYEDFTLQQAVGIQFRMSSRWDLRIGLGDFHFSNAFLVPNNPGIDEMMYGGGLCYHIGTPQGRF